MADMLFTAEGVTKKFGGVTALDNVSMSIARNSIFGLIGPNGAGKSTLLRLLSGRDAPDHGDVTSRRGVVVGYVAQDDVFPAGLSARDVIVTALASTDLEEHERDTRGQDEPQVVGDDVAEDSNTAHGSCRRG